MAKKKTPRLPFGTAGLPDGKITASAAEIRRRQRLPESRVDSPRASDAEVASPLVRDLWDEAGKS